MNIQLPEKVKHIIKIITDAGFEAYAVGGCIRDSILGREPEDWDITTSALPEQVKTLFHRTIDTGIQHGTVTIMLEKDGFEVTTYRVDGKYEDKRHPSEVSFTPNLEEDLRRRDFTINAMAYNEEIGLVDLFGGWKDIEGKVIRCVGDARERFTEDALRMMRAVRFSAQLGYEIEKTTKEAIKELAHNLEYISAERVQVELVKLVISDHPDYLRMAYETGITKVILPEFDSMMKTEQQHIHHTYDVGEHTLLTMENIEPDKVLRLAALFHDIGKPKTLFTDADGTTHFYGHDEEGAEMTKDIMRRLRFDNNTLNSVYKLVLFHDYGNATEPTHKIVRKAIYKMGEETFPNIFRIKKADILGQSQYQREEKLQRLIRWEQIYNDIVKKQECVSLKTLAVTGKDLIELGMEPGEKIGNTLTTLLELVLEHPEYNNKEILLEHVSSLKK